MDPRPIANDRRQVEVDNHSDEWWHDLNAGQLRVAVLRVRRERREQWRIYDLATLTISVDPDATPEEIEAAHRDKRSALCAITHLDVREDKLERELEALTAPVTHAAAPCTQSAMTVAIGPRRSLRRPRERRGRRRRRSSSRAGPSRCSGKDPEPARRRRLTTPGGGS